MIENYIINYDVPWFEITLINGKQIDVTLDVILEQIKIDNEKLNYFLDKTYNSFEDIFAYLEWCEIDVQYYLENYLSNLEKNDNLDIFCKPKNYINEID
jgi:hypothetical protein